jgi:glycosyltransferase involved in cell wall biosynthesis
MQLAKAVRAYIKQHHIGLVHTHTPRTTVIASLALGTRRPAKLVTTKHLHAVSQERANWGWLFKSVDRCAVYFPDQIIAVSNDVGDQIRSLPGVRANRVQVIQNAVDIEAYDAPDQRSQCRAEFEIPSGAPLLGFAGRIAKQKRVDLLLEAFAKVSERHPQVHLLIAGEGEESELQQAYARELGVNDRVIWAGYRRDMPRLLAAMDIYVQSSVNEGLSLSLLQAMAARTPVVATDVGGTREVVNQETGLLIPSGSSEPLASAILDILRDPAGAARRVDKAWQLVNERFSVAKQMEQYRTVYERLCEV